MAIDPYDDGIAITLELARTVSAADRDLAGQLLREWLAPYEGEPMRYRNASVDATPGATRIVLWADRIDDPEGASAAIERASAILERAKSALPVASGRLESAERAASDDLEARLGTTAIPVTPGGDASAHVAPGRSPPGVRPHIVWLAPAIIARLVARGLDAPASALLSDGAVIVTVVVLSFASRAWLTRREHAMAIVAVLAAAAHAARALGNAESGTSLGRLGVTLVAVAWAAAWLHRGRGA